MIDSRPKIALLLLVLACFAAACVQVKEAGRTIGHTTRDVTREIGHTTRDVTKRIGHGARDVTREIGHGSRDAVQAVGGGEVKNTTKASDKEEEY